MSCFEFGDADNLDHELVTAFPKLKDCGGYELLRVVDKNRLLEVIPVPPDGYTAKYLKNCGSSSESLCQTYSERPFHRTCCPIGVSLVKCL